MSGEKEIASLVNIHSLQYYSLEWAESTLRENLYILMLYILTPARKCEKIYVSKCESDCSIVTATFAFIYFTRSHELFYCKCIGLHYFSLSYFILSLLLFLSLFCLFSVLRFR